jgi:uncharacterized protein
MNLAPLLRIILDQYPLPIAGIHGVAHWARVLENGLRLAAQTGADAEVVTLFAVLHDSQRLNEGSDPEHGPRAAEFAAQLRGTAFQLGDEDFLRLTWACHGHTHQHTHPDVTVQTCWDSDRLDLGRVGITPCPTRLCTEAARRKKMIRWANDRASAQLVPTWVIDQWGIDRNDVL